MEDTLGEKVSKPKTAKEKGLNPCSNGMLSDSKGDDAPQNQILILVLMECSLTFSPVI